MCYIFFERHLNSTLVYVIYIYIKSKYNANNSKAKILDHWTILFVLYPIKRINYITKIYIVLSKTIKTTIIKIVKINHKIVNWTKVNELRYCMYVPSLEEKACSIHNYANSD